MTLSTMRSDRSGDSERGAALIMALFVTAALVLLGGAFLATSLSESTVTKNEADSARAFGLAEAGIERGRVALGGTSVNSALAAGTLLANQSLGGGTYGVVVTNNIGAPFASGPIAADPGGASTDTDGYVVLTSTGVVGTARRQVELVVRQNMTSFGTQVVFGDLFVQITGSGDFMAPLGSNGNITPGTQEVYGNAAAHGAVVPSPNAHIHGTITNAAPVVTLPAVGCPGSAYGGPAITGTAPTFNAGTGDVTFGAGTNSALASGTYYYHNFTHSGAGRITVATGATVTIYISGQANMAGGGFSNANSHAGNLQIQGCGADTTAWSLSNAGGITQYLTVYAPTHAFTFAGGGGSDFYGGFVAKSIDHASGGNVYYDTGVTVGSPTFAKVTGTWGEVF